MYHGAGCTTSAARFAMCWRDTSSTSASSEYWYGTPASSFVGRSSVKSPVGGVFASRLTTGDSSGCRSTDPTNVQRSPSGNASKTACGAEPAGLVQVHVAGRPGIAAPNRYFAETVALTLSPAVTTPPLSATSTRKSGRRYAATRNEPWTDFWLAT